MHARSWRAKVTEGSLKGNDELELKRKELRLSFWTNTILVGVLGGLGTVAFSLLDLSQKQSELLIRQQEISFSYGDLEYRLVGEPIQRIVKAPCTQEAKDQNTYLQAILNAGIVGSDAAAKYDEIARNLMSTCPQQSQTPAATCDEIKDIKALGWRSGHKTNFCRAHGYDGVWNVPNSTFSSGGYCYKGDSEACRRKIARGARK